MHFYEKGSDVTWGRCIACYLGGSASHNFLVESIRCLTRESSYFSEESEDAAEGLIDHAKWF